MKKALLISALVVGAVALPVAMTGCQSTQSASAKSGYTCAMCGGSSDSAGKCPHCGMTMEKKCPNCGNAMSKCSCPNMR